MRILASNPDTIGDLVLRQPMYHALRDAGHELVLVVRPLVEHLAATLFPGVRTLVCHADPYVRDPDPHASDLDDIAQLAREADPDMLLVAPFQWTRLEERLAFALPRAGKAMLSGRRFAHEEWGEPPPSGIVASVRVDADEQTPEVEKNRRLASALLGVNKDLPRPRIEPASEHLAAARQHLDELGLRTGEYWVACVGESQWTAVRNWPIEAWSRALGAWAQSSGRRFLLVGNELESASSRRVIEGMGEHASSAVSWSGVDPSDVGTLVGLVALSRGYVGRDTGPMHLAAALDKPVLAVFGGGTWPRFLPAASRSVSLAMRVPCFGCDWRCHLPESYCVKRVPEDEVHRAMEDLERARVTTPQTRLLEPTREVLETTARQGAEAVRSVRVALTHERRASDDDRQRLDAMLEQTRQRVDQIAARLDEQQSVGSAELQRAMARAQELAAELARARQELADRDRSLETARESLDTARRETEAARADARDQAILLESERERTHVLGTLSRQLQTDLDGTYAELQRVRERLLGAIRQRDELLASRWRRYGQKFGLVMVMPWEKGLGNGQPEQGTRSRS